MMESGRGEKGEAVAEWQNARHKAMMMMMPMEMGIVRWLVVAHGESEVVNKFCWAMILAMVYAMSIGGTSTLTGTGMNLIIIGMWKSLYPEAKSINFNTWFFYGFPVAILILLCFWLILCILYVPRGSNHALSTYLDKTHLKRDLEALGNFLTTSLQFFFFDPVETPFPSFRLLSFFVVSVLHLRLDLMLVFQNFLGLSEVQEDERIVIHAHPGILTRLVQSVTPLILDLMNICEIEKMFG
ncbi:hypothetical protein Fmac_018734 [Flemingia macrophylla]|uniref:Tonoplast dicarboxylate transporter n=1 Tax=Flemingia macrophylla TaxID=520843 RepID=A0ABD1M5V9_9FABA